MNFVDILRRHNIPYQTEGRYCRPGWVQFHCPYCKGGSDPDKPYAGYNLAHGYINCWQCGHHKLERTLSLLTGLPHFEVAKLVGTLDREVVEEQPRGKLELPEHLLDINQLCPVTMRNYTESFQDYLRGRGYDPWQVRKLWHIRFMGLGSGVNAWRIFIPIHYKGEVVSWTTRTISKDHRLRYKSAAAHQEKLNHKDLLYGEDYCRGSHAVIVHEGPLDVWATGPGAVATFGTGFSRAQLNKLSVYPKKIVCFDNEPEAQKRAWELVDQLSVFDGEVVNVLLDSKDAGSMRPEEKALLRGMLA